MIIKEDKLASELTSIKIGGNIKYLVEINTEDDLLDALKFSQDNHLPFIPLGRGTNTIFTDNQKEKVVGKINISGIKVIRDFPESSVIEVGAGENWDDLVAWAVKNKLSGIESMSYIPGTVGAAPIQNIGAYGSEFSDVCVNVRAYDIKENIFKTFGLLDCDFKYRDSLFKQNSGRYIVTKVVMELKKSKPNIPDYKDVQLYFLGKDSATLNQIRKAIIEIRTKKLPDPREIPNVGSFFKNPIVEKEMANELIKKHPDMPHFETEDGKIKLYAGWLIEQLGLKGKNFGKIVIYKNNALVLTNPKEATYKDLDKTRKDIVKMVKDSFGIELEMEPIIFE
jgi:UDP-N-acetylmuramate dehydrogenase